jgi:serine/threonine protein kinase
MRLLTFLTFFNAIENFERCKEFTQTLRFDHVSGSSEGRIYSHLKHENGTRYFLKSFLPFKNNINLAKQGIRAQRKLPEHPNVISMVCHWEDDKEAIHVLLESRDGYIDLESHLRGKRGNLVAFKPFMKDVAFKLKNVLQFLHNHSVYHNDVKPGNILYNPVTHDIALTDFDFAGVKGKEPLTVGGTIGFCARVIYPVIEGAISPTDAIPVVTSPMADCYGLGATLSALLTADKSSDAWKPLVYGYSTIRESFTTSVTYRSRLASDVEEAIPKDWLKYIARLVTFDLDDKSTVEHEFWNDYKVRNAAE